MERRSPWSRFRCHMPAGLRSTEHVLVVPVPLRSGKRGHDDQPACQLPGFCARSESHQPHRHLTLVGQVLQPGRGKRRPAGSMRGQCKPACAQGLDLLIFDPCDPSGRKSHWLHRLRPDQRLVPRSASRFLPPGGRVPGSGLVGRSSTAGMRQYWLSLSTYLRCVLSALRHMMRRFGCAAR